MTTSRTGVLAHFTLADGRAFSLAATLFYLDREPRLLQSSLVDVSRRRCATISLGDARVPGVLLGMSGAFGRWTSPERVVRRALDEILAAGHLPFPDAIIERPDSMLRAFPDGRVELQLAYPAVESTCELAIVPRPSPVLRGWISQCDISGTVVIAGERHEIANCVGSCFETHIDHDLDRWVAHLDDATALYVWCDAGGAKAQLVRGKVIEAAHVSTLEPIATWTSRYTFHEYAVAWRIRGTIPPTTSSAAPRYLDLELRAPFPEQELVTVMADPSWRGRCDVTGTVEGRSVTGVAFGSLRARDATATLSELFASIPRETSRVIERQLPIPLKSEHVLPLLGDDVSRYVGDVDLGEFQRILIEPIREIIDRQGKAWRSYTAVLCYHALGGNPWREDVIDVLLGLAEVIHVGSLIVDDVEDASPTRRGGPAAHIAHGVPIAINAGTFCYFVWQSWFARLELPDAIRLQIYEIYFEFMRVAHLGQALDIQGFTRAMAEEIVATGDVTLVERQMKNVYMLKTGAPASVFARIGAIVAGGEPPQVRALADLFEALGIAFQIMDDVNNLKGFAGDPKHCEDLAQAKVTMPVLEAMRVLDLAGRRDLWDRIGRCGNDPALVPTIIETLETSGAFRACRDQAHRILEDAWRATAPSLVDSYAKIMLRSFCLHIVESLG